MRISNLPSALAVTAFLFLSPPNSCAQQQSSSDTAALQRRVEKLESEVAELKRLLLANTTNNASSAPILIAYNPPSASATIPNPPEPEPLLPATPIVPQSTTPPAPATESPKLPDFLHDATLNVSLDTYYANNFNSPVGRVNYLRAYDVLSNNFSLNQASLVLELAPNPTAARRWGGRLDLQYGQATDTLQGNPANEPRPAIYQNIFQAYGTYVVPVGTGLTVDFGKWSSSIGLEGNYTKDQFNYSRSYYFDYLPFYHMGARATYAINDRFSLNYWIVNGTNQAEATNGFKDELFGFTAKPKKSVTWTLNYYVGQEHPDRTVVATPTNPIPVQPGLNFSAISPAPNGKLHIFDTYVIWQATPKWSFAVEGDYVIQRLWQNQAPGRSAAPSHVDGAVAYAHYQLSGRFGFGARAEYLSDRGGLFSGKTQALKETTATFDYKLSDAFLMRYEWRRDFSNQPSFLSDAQGILTKQQSTATIGLIWWWGPKQGSW